MELGSRRRGRGSAGAKAGPYPLIWLVALPILGWALIRLLGLDGETVLAAPMAFTPWVAAGALFVAGVAVALENWAAAIVAAVSLALLAGAVLPRGLGHGEKPPANATSLTVLSANLYLGQADPEDLLGLAAKHRADLLFVQELTPRLASRLQRDGIRRLFPYAVISRPLGGFNRAVYSRVPLQRLADRDARPTAMPALGITLHGGRVVRMVDVHTRPPLPDRVGTWKDVLSSLPSAGSLAPWLLVGDFNATLDQSELRDVIDCGYRDAGAVTGDGLEMTWPTNRFTPPLVAIDHALADKRLGISSYGVEDLPGSDHRAIWATVFFRGTEQ